ncbi:MAG: hypothetical protein VYA34_00200 [Myxococcota bacterium]|nr:hypothetical protein [Myxococcota bacterium]
MLKKIIAHISYLMVPLSCLTYMGCGQDTFQQGFQPDAIVPAEVNLGPAYPVKPGDNRWYSFTGEVRSSDAEANANAETGFNSYVCIMVDKVLDTNTETYQSSAQTLVEGRVKMSGLNGAMTPFTKKAGSAASAADIEPDLQDLLLKKMILPDLTNPDFQTPSKVTFSTQAESVPGAASVLESLFFTDPRETERQKWGGWNSPNPDVESFETIVKNGFSTEFTPEFIRDNTKFKAQFKAPLGTCSDKTDAIACAAASCNWGQNGCEKLFQARVVWRTTTVAGVSAIHQIKLEYSNNGILNSAVEWVLPVSPTQIDGPVPSEIRDCTDGCISASLVSYDSFFSNPDFSAGCAFE